MTVYRDGRGGGVETSGYSLLEVLFGLLILAMVSSGALLLSNSSIRSNVLGKELADASQVLKSFVDEVRSMESASLPRNREQVETHGKYQIRWRIYDESSAGAYRQPRGLLLLCVQASYTHQGRSHRLATATFLGGF